MPSTLLKDYPPDGLYNVPMTRMRLDLLLVERGLVASRSLAQALIMAGDVRVEGQVEYRSSAQVAPGARLELAAVPRFVSRGGDKLEAALQAFPIQVAGRLCADVGSSTGGFTDCLLQHGAAKVYAIDVGKGLLHWKLRQDPRLVILEGTNARFLEKLAQPVGLVTIDASFISLKLLLPVVKAWIDPAAGGDVIALIKPQFEAGRRQVARGKGVIRDSAIQQAVLQEIRAFALDLGFIVHDTLQSPVVGPKGNIEFLVWLQITPTSSARERL